MRTQPRLPFGQGFGEVLQLHCNWHRPGTTWRRAPSDRHAGTNKCCRFSAESWMIGDQFAQTGSARQRLAHERTHDGVGLAKRNALHDQPLGEVRG